MNRHGESVALIGQVRETADRLGSPPLQSRADELARTSRARGTTEEAWWPLTAREFEVARLVAEGLTNAEIAERLTIAPKTASAHIEHILAKLGVTRRAEIAAWAANAREADRAIGGRIRCERSQSPPGVSVWTLDQGRPKVQIFLAGDTCVSRWDRPIAACRH